MTFGTEQEVHDLLERLQQGIAGTEDLRELKVAAISAGNASCVQLGKFVVNLGAAENIHIGDKIIVSPDSEAIRRQIRLVHDEIVKNSFELSLREYFRSLRQYAAEFPYLSLDFPLGKSLPDVYVPLDLISDFSQLSSAQRESQASDIRTALNLAISSTSKSMLLLGGPGAGKSTLLRQILRNAWDSPSEIGLDCPHIPILVRFQFLMTSSGGLEERLWGACKQSNDYVISSPPPQGWFSEWPKITGSPWLLLFDGLDEVPQSELKEVEAWLRKVQASGYASVMTARNIPAVTNSSFLRSSFTWYQIGALTGNQQRQLIANWVGNDTERFLESFNRLRIGLLSGTPLLLTIAAVVFHSGKMLPSRRSLLYRRYVDTWLKEALKHGLERELGQISPYIWEGLSFVAFLMSTDPGCRAPVALRNELASFFHVQLAKPRLEAAKMAALFIEATSQRSGLFALSQQGNCTWLHATFHEFLTATALSTHDDPWQFILHWRQDHWRSVTTFLFDIWSETREVSAEISRIILDRNFDAQVFAAELISGGASVGTKVAQKLAFNIVTALVAELKTESLRVNDPKGLNQLALGSQEVLRLLSSIRKLHDLTSSLSMLAKTLLGICRGSNGARAEIQALEQSGRVKELKELYTTPAVPSLTRLLALSALVRLDEVTTIKPHLIEVLSSVPESETRDPLNAISTAGRLDLLEYCFLKKGLAVAIRVYATALFCARAPAPEVIKISKDLTLPNAVRMPSIIAARRFLESKEHKSSLFVEWESENGSGSDVPFSSFLSGLVDLSAWDEIAKVASDAKIPVEYRVEAVGKLADGKCVEQIVDLAASDTREVRLKAALMLHRLKHDDESIAFVLSALDSELPGDTVSIDLLLEKADFLRTIGRHVDAVAEYSKILENTPNDIALCHRSICYEELGRYAEAHADLTLSLTLSDDAWTHARRGKVSWLLGDYHSAIADFNIALKLGSTATWFYTYLGDSYTETLNFKSAIRRLDEAIASGSNSTDYAYRGKAYLAWGKFYESINDFNCSLELNPASNWVKRMRAECKRKMGRYEDVLEDLKSSLQSQNSTTGLSLAIAASLQLGLVEKAGTYVSLATRVDHDPWFEYLDALYRARVDWKDCVRLIKRAMSLTEEFEATSKDLDRLYSNRAIFCIALGDQLQAKKIYEDLLLSAVGRFRIRRYALTEIEELARLLPERDDIGVTRDWLRAQAVGVNKVHREYDDEHVGRQLSPLYCSLKSIISLDREQTVCAKLLSSKKLFGPAVALLQLPEEGWVYGQCNFKMMLTSDHDLKFVDKYETFLNRNVELIARGLGQFTIVFAQPEFLEQFRAEQIEARFNISLLLQVP